MENDRSRGVSIGEEMCFNRIISRNSSVGYSSRIYYYCRSSQGIPFNWEMQPGTPKEPPQKEDEILPPISPPPALFSLRLPKPCINIVDEPKPKPSIMKLKMFKFWKQAGKRNNKKVVDDRDQSDKYSNYDMSSSNDGVDFMASSSPRISSCSSSSSFSFSTGVSFRSSSPSRESSLNRQYGCSPLNFSSLLVRVSRSR